MDFNNQSTPKSNENNNQNSSPSKCPVIMIVDNIGQILNDDSSNISIINSLAYDNNDNYKLLKTTINNEDESSLPPYETFFKLHRMNRGISRTNVFASYLGSFLSICFFVFINVAQPFILNNLNIPDSQQGDVSGNLTFYNELTILLASHGWGIASDKFGRRIVYCLGMIIVGFGLLAYPFAETLQVLIVFRLLFGIGAASLSSMLSAVLGDYVVFQDRGRASGFLGFAAGGGAVLGSLVLLKIPNLILNSTTSISTIKSVQITYAMTAGLAFLGAGFLMIFLKKHNPKDPSLRTHNRNILKIAKEGIIAGKKPVLSLAYGSGFIARGDSAIATTFLSLWIYNYALTVNGGRKDLALSSSGTISGISQTFGLFFSLVAGYMMDKLNRVFSMILLAIIGCVGYFMLAFSVDPLSSQFFVGACIIGCAEIGMVVSSTSLVAQESPGHVRGSTSGVFSACGCLGILIASKIGGMYFDQWNGFPFFLFGIFSGILIIWGIIVFILTQYKSNRSNNFFKNLFLNLIKNDDTKIIINNDNNNITCDNDKILNNNITIDNNNNINNDKFPLINDEKIE